MVAMRPRPRYLDDGMSIQSERDLSALKNVGRIVATVPRDLQVCGRGEVVNLTIGRSGPRTAASPPTTSTRSSSHMVGRSC